MCSATPKYSTLEEVRERLREIAPHLTRYDELEPANYFKLAEKLMQVGTYRYMHVTCAGQGHTHIRWGFFTMVVKTSEIF